MNGNNKIIEVKEELEKILVNHILEHPGNVIPIEEMRFVYNDKDMDD